MRKEKIMFKKLKSLFVIDEQGNSEAPATNPTKKDNVSNEKIADQKASIKIEKPVYNEDNPPKGKPNEKFVNILLGAIEKNNVDGFDYLEFKQALQNLGGVEMDEGTKFQSALAMAKTMGASKQVLFDSAELYLKVLSKEEAKFMESFMNQVNRQVDTRNQNIKNLEQGIALKKKQIEELQNEIEKQEKALNEKKSTANKANAKAQTTKENFYHSYHIVTEQIKGDIAKMKQYLK